MKKKSEAVKKKTSSLEREISADNCIDGFMHCVKCIEERPRDQSPREWARLEVGWTEIGLQIRCVRHELNVAHIDFEGAKHPANTRASDRPNSDAS